MTLMELIFAAVLSLGSSFHPGETPEQYGDRLELIADAVASETTAASGWQWSRESLARAVVATFHAESRFALPVHSGALRGDGGRSACLGQVQALGPVTRSAWRSAVGIDIQSTRACVRATIQHLTLHQVRCSAGLSDGKHSISRVFAGYRSGTSCAPDRESERRAQLWNTMWGRL